MGITFVMGGDGIFCGTDIVGPDNEETQRKVDDAVAHWKKASTDSEPAPKKKSKKTSTPDDPSVHLLL